MMTSMYGATLLAMLHVANAGLPFLKTMQNDDWNHKVNCEYKPEKGIPSEVTFVHPPEEQGIWAKASAFCWDSKYNNLGPWKLKNITISKSRTKINKYHVLEFVHRHDREVTWMELECKEDDKEAMKIVETFKKIVNETAERKQYGMTLAEKRAMEDRRSKERVTRVVYPPKPKKPLNKKEQREEQKHKKEEQRQKEIVESQKRSKKNSGEVGRKLKELHATGNFMKGTIGFEYKKGEVYVKREFKHNCAFHKISCSMKLFQLSTNFSGVFLGTLL
jgi:hypothetical protein